MDATQAYRLLREADISHEEIVSIISEVRDNQKKIQAIRRLRDAGGVGVPGSVARLSLKECKDAVEALMGLDVNTLQRIGLASGPSYVMSLDNGLTWQVLTSRPIVMRVVPDLD